MKILRWFLVSAIAMLVALLVNTSVVSADPDGGFPPPQPSILVVSQAGPTGLRWTIYNLKSFTMEYHVEAWVYTQPFPFQFDVRPAKYFSVDFSLPSSPGQTVTLDGWPGVAAGLILTPIRFWGSPGAGGITGSSPFYWAGSALESKMEVRNAPHHLLWLLTNPRVKNHGTWLELQLP